MNILSKLSFIWVLVSLSFFTINTIEASPCTNNYWNPTFVHDLDYPDGPWYVTSNGQFAKLRIVDNWDWTPHACELISKGGVRNTKGYTNCEQYTRIQCGCQRGLSESNSTCARFLANHKQKYAVLPYKNTTQASNVIGVTDQEITNALDTGHHVQVWKIDTNINHSGNYTISVKHAAAGSKGSFYITAWADTDFDGKPDKEIGRSQLMVAQSPGQWSSWSFSSNYQRIFVGNTWSQNDERVYYQSGGTVSGYQGLGNTLYYSRHFNGVPDQSTGPRYTNIRVQLH